MRPMPQPISTSVRCVVLAVAEPEAVEVDGHLAVAGRDELGERQRVAGLVVEDPAGGLHDLVGAGLLLGDAPGDLPGDELGPPAHRRKYGSGVGAVEFGLVAGCQTGARMSLVDGPCAVGIDRGLGRRGPTRTHRRRAAPALLDLLGEDDPFLRDEVGYGVLARWVVQDHLLGADELRYAVDRLVPDLRLGLDGERRRRRQAAVRRSYSALALAILAYRDVEDHFLGVAGVRALLDAGIDYLLDEPDRRGYVPGARLDQRHRPHRRPAQVPRPQPGAPTPTDHRRVLAALQTLLTRANGPVFVDDEEDRLVLVVVDVIGRETVGDDELVDWIDRFGSWLAGQPGVVRPGRRGRRRST